MYATRGKPEVLLSIFFRYYEVSAILCNMQDMTTGASQTSLKPASPISALYQLFLVSQNNFQHPEGLCCIIGIGFS